MPERHVDVGDFIDANRMRDFTDVEEKEGKQAASFVGTIVTSCQNFSSHFRNISHASTTSYRHTRPCVTRGLLLWAGQTGA